MDLSQKLDLVVVIIANLLNLVLSLIFLNRVFGRAAWEHWLGYGTLIMIFPLTIIALANLAASRNWGFWILPLIMVLFLAVEFIFDYWLKFDFRHTAWLGPYLLLYYLALFAMIGYAFLAGKLYGYITLITYFTNLAATFFSYARVGHRV
jgi:hypothetical protein